MHMRRRTRLELLPPVGPIAQKVGLPEQPVVASVGLPAEPLARPGDRAGVTDQHMQLVGRGHDQATIPIGQVAAGQVAEAGRRITGRAVPAKFIDARSPGRPIQSIAAQQATAQRRQCVGPSHAVTPICQTLTCGHVERPHMPA